MKKINNGYSVITVVFILTFISLTLSLTIVWVSHFLRQATMKINKYSDFESFYEALDYVLPEMGLNVKDNITSPWDGWFSELPDEVEGHKMEYLPEDNKIDVNHVKLSYFFKLEEENANNIYGEKTVFIDKVDEYFYYPEDVWNLMNPENSSDYKDSISIYNVPNLNISDTGRIKLYLNSFNIKEQDIESFIGQIKNYRKGMNYIKYKGTKKSKSGLIINEYRFNDLKKYEWPEDDFIYKYFDYKGNINLNFVDEKTFELSVKACGPKKVNYKKYWLKIKQYHESENSIKENDIKKIFKNERAYYEKIFGVDSNLFKINIVKDDKILTAFVRRYKDRERFVKILKISISEYVEQKEITIEDEEEDS